MVSALCSRKFGFGLPVRKEELTLINNQQYGTRYADKEAATKLLRCTKKHALEESPFVRKLEYGRVNNYWTYQHMIVQLENCIDVMWVILPNRSIDADIIFELDHSSGHAHLR